MRWRSTASLAIHGVQPLRKTPFGRMGPKSTGWLLAGFSLFIASGALVASPRDGHSGRYVAHGLARPSLNLKQHGWVFKRYSTLSLSAQIVWPQWQRLGFLILNLSGWPLTVFPITRHQLGGAQRAIAWATWQRSYFAWRSLFLLSTDRAMRFVSAFPETCFLSLETGFFASRSQARKLWLKVPSFGANTSPDFDQSWAGIYTTNLNANVQYALLAWAWSGLA